MIIITVVRLLLRLTHRFQGGAGASSLPPGAAPFAGPALTRAQARAMRRSGRI